MAAEVFISLLGFAFVASVTPGPNNMMLLASGVNFGFWRTVPHMIGIAGGFALLLLCIGFGLGALLESYPAMHLALKLFGGGYLLNLAWRVATTRQTGTAEYRDEPMSMFAAAAFQWVNPKAWMMGATAMTLYTSPESPYHSTFLVTLAFMLVNFPSVSVWAGGGTALRGFLASPERLKWFNIAMGTILALSIVPMVI